MIRRDEPRRPVLSVVIPVYDEERIIPVLASRLLDAIDHLQAPAEVILVDDGSHDGTLAAISRAHRLDPRVVGLSLSRNFGHQAAISAGLAESRGDAVVVMDGDLQDPPEAIGPLWEKLKEGYDVVYAIRRSRPEAWFKRLAYRVHYRLLKAMGTIEIPVDAGDFGIMSRAVVDAINAMPEKRRYLRGLRAWVGFHQTGLEIDRGERLSGRPKFTLRKLFGLAIDGFIGFSDLPLRLVGFVGMAVIVATSGALASTLWRVVARSERPDGWVWVGLLVGFSLGLQSLGLAVVGVYVASILREVRARPLYVVSRRISAFKGDVRPRSRKRPIDSR